ncbi:sarcosine oxidase subunit gamma [Aquabacter sp. L1I39]|uniref:sarcosine oxidase subunit gamma n=1 Tax=Aquabacter sp. L1I39 TaxID=2820278 RepID=UPI001ADAE1D6|nr:sarcosine oxidase subunit gamma family protein [Aquabacter sp. L1I39]QTL02279.1 sarcosine oxidase subunit gamma [Aquabacter sp. L1I39]
MSDLLAHIAPTRLVPAGIYGSVAGFPGVTATVVEGLALATLAARKGKGADLRAAALSAFGLDLPEGPRVAEGGGLFAVGTAPDRWLVGLPGASGDDLLARLGEAFAGLASLTDQSDANLVLDLTGPQVGAALEKLVAVDLHPSVFGPGSAAATAVALIPILFWQVDGSPRYRFAISRSFAPAILRALTAAAAPLGFELIGTGRG